MPHTHPLPPAADNLNTSQSVSLVFVKDDAIKTAITLNDFDWADASNGGSQGSECEGHACQAMQHGPAISPPARLYALCVAL